eukprot:11160800-Lingulodinium_polyedra.AAC.1
MLNARALDNPLRLQQCPAGNAKRPQRRNSTPGAFDHPLQLHALLENTRARNADVQWPALRNAGCSIPCA